MVDLTRDIQLAFGLEENTTAEHLIDKLEDNPELLNGLLATQECLEFCRNKLSEYANYKIFVLNQLEPYPDHKYCALQFQGDASPSLIGHLSQDLDQAARLATNLENLIFWAILSGQIKWADIYISTDGGGNRLEWQERLRGRAILALPTDSKQLTFIAALFQLEENSLAFEKLTQPLIKSTTNVSIDFPSNQSNEVLSRLLFHANCETSPKWKFLSYYRILENSYLENIKKELFSKFDSAPKTSIEEAKKQLGSEINQLILLTDSSHLKDEFIDFNNKYDSLLKSSKFLYGIDREAKEELLFKDSALYKKAVLRFYKIRCAIAHAGTANVIYEQYIDADQAIMGLLPEIEVIVLKLLGIRIH